jgi:hypothetical protein
VKLYGVLAFEATRIFRRPGGVVSAARLVRELLFGRLVKLVRLPVRSRQRVPFCPHFVWFSCRRETARPGRHRSKTAEVARGAALGGKKAAVKPDKRGGACRIACGCSSSDAACVTFASQRENIQRATGTEFIARGSWAPTARFALLRKLSKSGGKPPHSKIAGKRGKCRPYLASVLHRWFAVNPVVSHLRLQCDA